MPNINPKVAGDNFYPQYNVSKPEPVSAITITKGRLYTKGTGENGNNLVAVGTTGFIHGVYQATRSILLAGTAGEHTVDCFGPRSRVGLPVKTTNLHPGDLIKYDVTTHDVSLWTGTAGGVTPNELNGIVGKIYKIYTKGTITTEKDITAIGDIAIVDLGVGI